MFAYNEYIWTDEQLGVPNADYPMREKEEEINWTDVAWNKDNKKVNYETNKMSSLYFKYNNGQIDIGNYCHFQQRTFPVIDNIAFWLLLVLGIDWSCDVPIYNYLLY